MNRILKVFFYPFLILTLITSCTSPTSNSWLTESDSTEEDQNPLPQEPSSDTEYPLPIRSAEQVFGDVAEGTIPVIISHGGAPSDIDAVVYLDKHPQVDLIGMVLSRRIPPGRSSR